MSMESSPSESIFQKAARLLKESKTVALLEMLTGIGIAASTSWTGVGAWAGGTMAADGATRFATKFTHDGRFRNKGILGVGARLVKEMFCECPSSPNGKHAFVQGSFMKECSHCGKGDIFSLPRSA